MYSAFGHRVVMSCTLFFGCRRSYRNALIINDNKLQATSNHIRQEGQVYSHTSSRATSTCKLQHGTRHVAYLNTEHVRQRRRCRLTGEPISSCSLLQHFSICSLLCSFVWFIEQLPLHYLVTFTASARYDARCDNCDARCDKGARYEKPRYKERGLTECDARCERRRRHVAWRRAGHVDSRWAFCTLWRNKYVYI